jgi:hypothetical protein
VTSVKLQAIKKSDSISKEVFPTPTHLYFEINKFEISVPNLKEGLGTDGRIILKCMLKETVITM